MKDELDLRVRRPLREVSPVELAAVKSEAHAISEMVSRSGLQDKTVALEIDVDNAILSKSKSGQARLSEAHMDRLMDACGSELWLMYWLAKRGYDPASLRRFESDVERENRLLREQLDKLNAEREVELRLFSRLRAA